MPKTVLLVEDDEILRSLLVEALSLIDVVAVECASADQALLVLESSLDFDLVITDICMPGSMDGLALAKTIWSRWPDLSVVVSSGNRVVSHDALPQHCSFLRKPWALDDLHQVVSKHLATRR